MKKRIIITGATGGIGQSIAGYLANKQYDLILSSRSKNRLQKLQEKLQKTSSAVEYQPLDYTCLKTLSEYRDWLQYTAKRIDGVVLITPRPNVQDTLFPETDVWHTLFQSGFIGPVEFIKMLLPYCNRGSKIVIISGISSIQCMDNHTMHGVLRAMWISQAKTMAHTLGPQEIYVNTVSPGGVLTDQFVSRLQSKAEANNVSFDVQYEKSVENVPLRKYAHPEDVASTVEFFLSNQSNHITGVNLACDGGFIRSY